MNTEFTKLTDGQWFQGWILFDALCPTCRRFARLLENVCTRRGFDIVPFQTSWVSECLDAPDTLSALRLITVGGQSFDGADALIYLARRIWWTWPVVVFAHIPGAAPLLRRAYGFCASYRRRDACCGTTRSIAKANARAAR